MIDFLNNTFWKFIILSSEKELFLTILYQNNTNVNWCVLCTQNSENYEVFITFTTFVLQCCMHIYSRTLAHIQKKTSTKKHPKVGDNLITSVMRVLLYYIYDIWPVPFKTSEHQLTDWSVRNCFSMSTTFRCMSIVLLPPMEICVNFFCGLCIWGVMFYYCVLYESN